LTLKLCFVNGFYLSLAPLCRQHERKLMVLVKLLWKIPLIELFGSIGGIDGVCTASERMDSDEGYYLANSLDSLRGSCCHVSLSAVSLPESFGNSVYAAGERLLTRLLLPPYLTKRRPSLNNGRLRNLYISVNIEALTELCSHDMTVSSFNQL
jgi:hypothetical protein